MQFRNYFFETYLFLSFFWFCCFSQTNSDLVKGVLLGALIARQKSGDQKIIVIPVSGDKNGGHEEEEYESTTTESSTTTTTTPMKHIKSKNTEIMQSMRQMAEMIQQILGQKTQQSVSTTPRPRTNKYGQQMSQQKKGPPSSGKHVMMMMPVVSMKNMDDTMESQSMTMMGSDNIEHIEDVEEYDEEPSDESSNERQWVAHYKGKKLRLKRQSTNQTTSER